MTAAEKAGLDQQQAEARDWFRESDRQAIAAVQVLLCMEGTKGWHFLTEKLRLAVFHLANLKIRELANEFDDREGK